MNRKLGLFVFMTGLLVLSLFVGVETRSASVEKDNFSASSDGNGLGSSVTINIPLWQAWNLISFPILPTNNSVVSVFSNVTGFKYLYWYNASEPDPVLRWKIWDNTIPPELWEFANTLWYVEPNRAYWLWVDYNQTLSVVGTVLSNNTVPLYVGWNFVSFQMYNDTVPNAMNQLTGFAYLYWYNASEPDPVLRWKIWDNTIPPEYYDTDNTLKRIEPTRGYWLWMTDNQTWYEELA